MMQRSLFLGIIMLYDIDNYWLTWSIILIFLTVRYGVIAGVFFVWWYVVKREQLSLFTKIIW